MAKLHEVQAPGDRAIWWGLTRNRGIKTGRHARRKQNENSQGTAESGDSGGGQTGLSARAGEPRFVGGHFVL